ncbi:unnamed protein product [Brassica rapa subsp. trilocularis]
MEAACRVTVVVLGTLAVLIHLVQAQDQQGFISLDCGLPAEELSSPYDEPSTGLRFSSDAAYIQSGQTGSIQPNRESQYLKPYRRLRYFPNGSRNCYNLNVEKGSKYLVRAFFVYENYDGLNIKPKFDLYLGPNLWSTIDFQEPEEDVRRVEMLHIPTSNSLQICLVKNGTTTPLISTLEIRPPFIKKKMYPSDRYDRVWTSYSSYFRNEWIQIFTTLQVEVNNLENYYDPPNAALTSAATPTNSNLPLMINWTSRGKCSLQLIRTNTSTLPPLINALEVYTVIHFSQSETNENDVVSVQNIKTSYRISKNSWQGDPCVPQQLMWEGLNCRITDKSTPPRITYLNLSSSGLTGTIADYIQNLTQLETLDLSNNNLTGEVPEFLGNMKSLVFINLSRNDLSGLIPQALLRKGLLDPQGNPRLCLSDSCLPPKSKPFPVAIVASLASVAIILVVLVLAFVLKKKKRSILGALQRPPSISSAVNVTNANPPVSPIQMNKKRFTYSEVINMTNNFQRVVGEGGFGIVYHGTLNVYEQVAVKLLSQSSTQGYKQFKAEVDLLMRVHHTNLVNLVGYCKEGDKLALIYEYVPNGDLRHHLSGKGGRSIINWGIRLRIALEAALGLEYLHIGCIPAMVHRDVKTTNILLDEQFKARLADFGLSRSFPVGGESHVSTMIAGTPGYLDPQYYRTSRLTEKSDVYSFGIVLLEMITNQPVIDQSREKSHITQWVEFELISGDIRTIMDPNLQGDYDSHSVWRVLELAMSCTNPSSTKRPSMSQVVVELNECLASENSRRNMRRGRMESHSPAKVSMLIDTGMFPLCSKFFFDSHFCKILFLNVLHGLLRIFHNVMMLNFLSSYASSVSLGAVENTFTNFTIDSKESSSTVLHGNMESSLGLLLVLITSIPVHIVQAQDQKEVHFLDCGLPANELSPYNEARTGLMFSSDENFIQSGKIGRVQADRESEFLKPYKTLRYFPNGTRNCYNLTVEKGRNHLIRVFFVYANYDGFDINPNFDLYLGPNLWGTIDLQGQVKGLRAELLHIPIFKLVADLSG